MSGHGVGVSLNEFFCLCKIIFNKHVTFVKKAQEICSGNAEKMKHGSY